MPHVWTAPVDFRSVPSRTPTPEAIKVIGGVALLSETPNDPADPTTPMVVKIGNVTRSRVIAAPGAGEFRIRSVLTRTGAQLLPELEFHSSDEGLIGTADYYRLGTIFTRLRMESLIGHVSDITGVVTIDDLNTQYPPTTDLHAAGHIGRRATLTDGSAYVSDGVQWLSAGGGTPSAKIGATTAPVAAGAGQSATYDPPGGWSAGTTPNVAAGTAPDAEYVAPPGQGGSGDMSPNVAAGVTPDAGYNAPGGGSALVPADPTFALATAFPTTAATGAWWKLEQPATVDVDPLGTASVTRGVTAPVWFTGSTKVAKLAALAGLGYDTNPSISVAYLSYRFAKATIDAGSTLTFDFGSNSPDPAQTRLDIIARDGGGSSIIDTTNAKNSLLLYTGTWGVADSTTIVKPLTANAKQVGTFDLKAWVSARLLAGKAWSDVASVDITFVSVGTDDITERILYVSNFR